MTPRARLGRCRRHRVPATRHRSASRVRLRSRQDRARRPMLHKSASRGRQQRHPDRVLPRMPHRSASRDQRQRPRAERASKCSAGQQVAVGGDSLGAERASKCSAGQQVAIGGSALGTKRTIRRGQGRRVALSNTGDASECRQEVRERSTAFGKAGSACRSQGAHDEASGERFADPEEEQIQIGLDAYRNYCGGLTTRLSKAKVAGFASGELPYTPTEPPPFGGLPLKRVTCVPLMKMVASLGRSCTSI